MLPCYRCDKFYDLPSTKEKRATSFGYGHRSSFAKTERVPPPDTYMLTSDFSKTQKGKVYTFGICRDAYKKVYLKINTAPDPSAPGPGTYDVRGTAGKEAVKYSLRQRTGKACKEYIEMY